jgi:manganese/zinc/iron transport system permease protein
MEAEFLQFTLPPLVAGVLTALACAMPGSYLILRREALLGDALSHAVFPGIVAAYLVSGGMSLAAMFAGAFTAGMLASLAITLLRDHARIEPGAAMGLVFTTFFASGVVLLEMGVGKTVHLDVEHALFGSLESLVWLDAGDASALLDPRALRALPIEVAQMAAICLVNALALFVLRRPLLLLAFDRDYARTMGIATGALALALAALTALAAVAAFSAVGAILAIAMLVGPPAAAQLMSTRFDHQIRWSLAFAVLAAIGGFLLAVHGPFLLGFPHSVSASGMIAVICGAIVGLAGRFGGARHRNRMR